LSNPFDDEHIDTHRRCDNTHLGDQHNDDAEPDGIESQPYDHGEEYGYGNNHQGHRVHKEAADEIDKNHDPHNGQGRDREARDPVCKDEGDRGYGQEVTEDGGPCDDEHDHAGGTETIFAGIQEYLPGQFPSNQADDQRSASADGSCLGGAEPTEKQSTDCQHKEDGGFYDAAESLDFLSPGRRAAGRPELGVTNT